MLLLEEKGKNMVARLSDLRATIHNSKARQNAAKIERNEVGEEVGASEGRLQGLYSSFNELTRASEAATKARRQAEEAYTNLATSLRSQETALDATRNNLNKTTDSMASLDLEEGLLRERFDQIDVEYGDNAKLLATRNERLSALENELLKLTRAIDLSKTDIDKFIRLLDERKKRHDEQNAELQAARARLTSLEEIDRAMEAASPALSWALENRDSLKGVVGPLAQSLQVKSSARLPFDMDIATVEGLIERLLGTDFFGLLVRNNDAAQQVAERLSSDSKLGALSILPLEGMRFLENTSARGERLIDFLDYPHEQRDTIAALLGDVYLTATVTDAQNYHLRDRTGARFVTPQGAIVWPNGKLTVGFMLDDVEGVLERRRSIEKLNDELERMYAAITDVELEVSTAAQELEAAQNENLALSQQQAKIQGEFESLRDEVTRLEQAGSQMEVRRLDTERKLTDVGRRRDTTVPMAGEYAERINKLLVDIERLQGETDEASKELLAATEEKNAVAERLSECKIELETSKGKENYSRNRLAQIDAQLESLQKTLDVSSETEASLNVIRLRIDPLYQLYEELHAGARRWAEKLHDQALLEQTDSTNLRKVISEANKAVEEARTALGEINERRTAVLVEQGKLESSVEHAMQRIVGEYGASLEAALELPSPENRQQAEERANRLRSKIANLGAVNQVAMEEYNALKARRDYMHAQIDDLQEARKALAKISAALDKKMRNQFLETFDTVNRNFQEIIEILFPGGKGELILTEGEDPDQNGVEVSAQPQGKKILKLSMMSGGEKSLVALALMFAVYSIRRVPFYVLDEVEAALDDTNLLRLLDYLNHLRSHTQLILVSHQRRTMETADVLYGVTMQAAGVSKLVSQRLDQALGYASKDVAGNDE
jgi:chromosome segregation protein